MPTYKVHFKVCLVLFLSMAVGCGGDDGVGANDDGGDTPDTTAPANVADLDTPTIPPSSPPTIIPLTWTAPGDDGTVGTAAQYDIRYSTALITDANFNSATQAPNLPVPSAAGSSETFDVTGLTENTTYYFALKTADEVPNSSGLSNVIQATTPDATAPADVVDLASPSSTGTSVSLTWTAPGGDGAVGTAAQYDIRYSTALITDANFDAATQAANLPVPAAAGTAEAFDVTGLTENTTYYFALKTADDWGNSSGLSNVINATTPYHIPQFVLEWGSLGSGDGEFSGPIGVAVDGSDNVYVLDTSNNRIQKFDGAGTFLTEWGSQGSGDGQFGEAWGIAVDGNGNVYVADSSNDRVQKFDGTGTFLTKWGSLGTGDGQLQFPKGIDVDGSGNVYVVDTNNHRIQKFDDTGTFLTKWGSVGGGDGQFLFAKDITVDGSGNVYVADSNNHRIQKFDDTGTFLTKWGSQGSGDGEFDFTSGIAEDGSGNIYVTDRINRRIQRFDSMGTFLSKWGSRGAGDDQFQQPRGIAIDGSGNVYVVDGSNNRVQKFN